MANSQATAQTIAKSTAPAAPAGLVFAPAIAAADERERQAVPVARDDGAALAPLAAPALATPVASTVRADTGSQAPVDMTQPQWPHSMIERIEHLRDAADAMDTRIRLVPDRLGAIAVTLKQEGDTLHVHFAAEQAETRTMLADAQPRLAEAAEARGLKLGQTSVDGGGANANANANNGTGNQQAQTGNGNGNFQSTAWGQGLAQGQGQSRQQQPATPARPVSAPSSNTPADLADDDVRIA